MSTEPPFPGGGLGGNGRHAVKRPAGQRPDRAALSLTLLALLAAAPTVLRLAPASRSSAPGPLAPRLLPWQSVGGCGAGGGGSTPGAVKWLGTGVSGTLLDFEVTGAQTVDIFQGAGIARTTTRTLSLRTNIHARHLDFGLSLPLHCKSHLSSAVHAVQVAGPGDLSLDVNKRLGMEGQLAAGLALSLPTGHYEIHDPEMHLLLPSDAQLGGGLFGGSVSGEYTWTRDWGVIMAGASYSGGIFALEPSVRGAWNPDNARPDVAARRFAFARDGAGARNGVGVLGADNLCISSYAAVKYGRVTQGFGGSFSFPMREEEIATVGTPYPTVQDTARSYQDMDATYPYEVVEEAVRGDPARYPGYSWIGLDSDGYWRVRTVTIEHNEVHPSMNLQYSFELATRFMPVLVAFLVPVKFDRDGEVFSGFGAVIGMKLEGI